VVRIDACFFGLVPTSPGTGGLAASVHVSFVMSVSFAF
jgi:hypothetical protein